MGGASPAGASPVGLSTIAAGASAAGVVGASVVGVAAGVGTASSAPDRRAALRTAVDRSRPVALAGERLLPVGPALAAVLPGGALRRGTVVALEGVAAASLGLGLVAAASASGSWVGVVGLPELGLVAAGELGVALSRVVLVQPSAERWPTAMATLVDAFDVVVVGGRLGAGVPRLVARIRERGAVVVVVGSRWPSPDVVLRVEVVAWDGIGDGHGHLRGRRVLVRPAGRRVDPRAAPVELWLPDPDGTIRLAAPGVGAGERGPHVADPQGLGRQGVWPDATRRPA